MALLLARTLCRVRPGFPGCLSCLLQQFERLQDRLAGEQAKQRPPEAQRIAHVENARGGLIVEQNAVLQIADDDSFGQVEQDCFEPALLLFGALRGVRNRLCRPGPRCGELLRQLLDGTRKPFEGMARGHQQLAILLGQGQRFRFTRQDLDGPHDPHVKNGPG
ncbi:MAG TPA: hypothetical protein VHJ58_02015, partial [Vicinamibacterales bacterium]|nr:hypothetical protein [Vicinamibacterales bacterium]